MPPQQTDDVQFRCKNRFGRPELQVTKCEDYGSKGHPGNLLFLKAQELPPGNRLPKCPCCGLELEPVRRGPNPNPKPKPLPVMIGIAVLAICAAAWFMWPGSPPPPPPPPTVEQLLKEVWPSLR